MYYKSNIYQLVNKSDIKPTATKQGVAFTNNFDGSLTLNGTAVKTIYQGIATDFILDRTHKYLWTCNNTNAPEVNCYLQEIPGSGAVLEDGVGKIFTPNVVHYGVLARIIDNATVTNVKIIPQIYDLTEMYGAGNEPETVDQFKQDYPNLPYEYSNNGWSKIRKLHIVQPTRNLCDLHTLFYDSVIDKQYERYGFWQAELSVKPDTYYTISRENADRLLGYLGMDNASRSGHPAETWLNHDWVPSYCRKSITIKSSTDGKLWVYFNQNNYTDYHNGINRFGYLQVEEGQQATAYQPHGYLRAGSGKYIVDESNHVSFK